MNNVTYITTAIRTYDKVTNIVQMVSYLRQEIKGMVQENERFSEMYTRNYPHLSRVERGALKMMIDTQYEQVKDLHRHIENLINDSIEQSSENYDLLILAMHG